MTASLIPRGRKNERFSLMRAIVEMTGRENFRVNVFNAILDRLMTELRRRCTTYEQFHDRFKMFSNITQLNIPDVSKLAKQCEHYSDDLEECFEDECQHLRSHLIYCWSDKQSTTPLQMCKSRNETELLHLFPNADIGLRLFVCALATITVLSGHSNVWSA